MIDIPLMCNNISKKDIAALIDFLNGNDILTQNKMVREFEEKWSKWLGVKYSVFVNSGSSANFISMHVISELYGKGEIIVSPLGWSSDVSSVINAGHTPVFADINMHNLSMNADDVINRITDGTKAVFLTHVLGFNALCDKLLARLKEKNILLVEDCCESHGATFKSRKIGTFGKASNFSFYYAHHMSTIEGGMICTDDKEFYQYARMFRSHGMTRECDDSEFRKKLNDKSPATHEEFTFRVAGFNMRSTELNAVLGISQLERLDSNNVKRYDNFKFFLENLNSNKYYTDFDIIGSINYALILILKEEDDVLHKKICNALSGEKVEFRRGTAGGGNMARQTFVKKHCPHIIYEELTNAEFVHKYGFYIGNYPSLEREKILKLCELLNNI